MIHFNGEAVHLQVRDISKTYSVAELLETYRALDNEPLSGQNEVFRQVIPLAESLFTELSPIARLHYDFWKNLQPNRIEPQVFTYTTQVTDTYQWELRVNSEGLFFQDISGEYGRPNQVFPQLLSEFWLYGPQMPLPELNLRIKVLALIRSAFLQMGGAAYQSHFPLFEYPELAYPKQWTTGDSLAGSFVILRAYGVESGYQNFHDGLVYLNFRSYEHCLTHPDLARRQLGGEVMAEEVLIEINQLITGSSPQPVMTQPERLRNDRSKQLYMENGGQIHYIYLDGFGDEYRATPAEEAAWKQELIEQYRERLRVENNEVVLAGLLRSLHYHDVPDAETILIKRADKATLRERQAIGLALWNGNQHEKGVEILLSLMAEQETGSYWWNFVWTTLIRMQRSSIASAWVAACLKSNEPRFSQKAAEVIRVWEQLSVNNE
jgi:hypothetical protein